MYLSICICIICLKLTSSASIYAQSQAHRSQDAIALGKEREPTNKRMT